jgi:hypothetical protein
MSGLAGNVIPAGHSSHLGRAVADSPGRVAGIVTDALRKAKVNQAHFALELRQVLGL